MYCRSFSLFLYCLYVKIDLEGWRKGVSALANFCLGFEIFGRSQVHDLGLEDTETFSLLQSNKSVFIPVWEIQSYEISLYPLCGFCDCLYEFRLWCLEYL